MRNIYKIFARVAVRIAGLAVLVFLAAQQLTIHAAEIPTETLGMEIDMTVRVLGKAGDSSLQKVVDAGPGNTVEFQIHFRNTSTITVDDVQFEPEYGWSQLIARGRAGFALNDFGMRESIATVNVYNFPDRFVSDSLFRTLLMLLTPIMSYR